MHISRRDDAALMGFLNSIVGEKQPFAGQTMIVTGASRGLGRGIAVVLLAAGINLGLPVRTVNDGFADELIAESVTLRRSMLPEATSLPGHVAPSIKVWQMDLADLSSVQACVSEMSSTNFRATALINNAGLTSPYDEVTAQGYELTVGVNFLGTAQFTLLLLKAGIIAGKPSGNGSADHARRIVMVSSEEHRADNIEPLQTRYSTIESFCKPDTEADGGMHNAMRRYATSKLLLTTFSHQLARRQSVRSSAFLMSQDMLWTVVLKDMFYCDRILKWLTSARVPLLLTSRAQHRGRSTRLSRGECATRSRHPSALRCRWSSWRCRALLLFLKHLISLELVLCIFT
eukprot:COSAG02_NODE_508_length_20916_cov_162.483691_18_plen_345_part_00